MQRTNACAPRAETSERLLLDTRRATEHRSGKSSRLFDHARRVEWQPRDLAGPREARTSRSCGTLGASASAPRLCVHAASRFRPHRRRSHRRRIDGSPRSSSQSSARAAPGRSSSAQVLAFKRLFTSMKATRTAVRSRSEGPRVCSLRWAAQRGPSSLKLSWSWRFSARCFYRWPERSAHRAPETGRKSCPPWSAWAPTPYPSSC